MRSWPIFPPEPAGLLADGNYALEAKLNPVQDAIFLEDKDSPFANVLVVRPEDQDKEALKKLRQALNSPEVKKFLEENYKR